MVCRAFSNSPWTVRSPGCSCQPAKAVPSYSITILYLGTRLKYRESPRGSQSNWGWKAVIRLSFPMKIYYLFGDECFSKIGNLEKQPSQLRESADRFFGRGRFVLCALGGG